MCCVLDCVLTEQWAAVGSSALQEKAWEAF